MVKVNSIETTLETDGSYSTMISTANLKQPVGVKMYRDTKGNVINARLFQVIMILVFAPSISLP